VNIVRSLCEGVGSWLHYEYSCNRSGLFSERYLSSAVGQILAGQTGGRSDAEYRHPVLAPQMTGPGRRPEIDFVVFGNYPKIAYAVESKWVGDTKPSIDSIVWDLIRLELIAHEDGAQCVFLLAGMRKSVEAYVAAFEKGPATEPKRYWLRTDSYTRYRLPLVATVPSHSALLKRVFRSYQTFRFPIGLVTRLTEPFPQRGKANQYVVYAWEVLPIQPRHTFQPQNSQHYAIA
jgi:hypothetical protein